MSMTPEQLTTVLVAAAAVVTAVGALIKQIMSFRSDLKVVQTTAKAVQTTAESIEKATNGAASAALATERALKETVAGLRAQLREEIEAAVAAARLAEQASADQRRAADDVRAATAPPKGESVSNQ